jgi:hypothetical protein
MAFLAATSVLRLQVLLGQLCTQFTPVTFPWHTLGRSSGIRSFDSARLLERAREATAGPGLLAAEDELRLLVRSLLGLTEYLDGQSSKIKDTSKTVSDYVKSRRSSSSVEQELGAFEWQPSAYGRTVMGDYPAAMFTICQAWLLLQLRKRGLAGGDLGGRWVEQDGRVQGWLDAGGFARPWRRLEGANAQGLFMVQAGRGRCTGQGVSGDPVAGPRAMQLQHVGGDWKVCMQEQSCPSSMRGLPMCMQYKDDSVAASFPMASIPPEWLCLMC